MTSLLAVLAVLALALSGSRLLAQWQGVRRVEQETARVGGLPSRIRARTVATVVLALMTIGTVLDGLLG